MLIEAIQEVLGRLEYQVVVEQVPVEQVPVEWVPVEWVLVEWVPVEQEWTPEIISFIKILLDCWLVQCL